MPRTLRYTGPALADLETVERWLTQPGACNLARRRLRAIRAAIQSLRQAPCRHPLGDRVGIREMTVERHRVLYSVHPDTGRNATAGDVVVLRVFGPGQSRDDL